MATNRIETLDPALIRPGRIDRKIEFPLPDEKTKRRIFSIHTNRMTLAEDVSLEDYVMAKDDLSGADIKVCYSLCSSLLTCSMISRWTLEIYIGNIRYTFVKSAQGLSWATHTSNVNSRHGTAFVL